MTINQTERVSDEQLDQMIWKLERDGGMTPKQLSLMRELREVRRAKGDGRDQFEEWFKFHHGEEGSIVTLHRANGGANYADPHVDLAWIAWKDSRAAMQSDGTLTNEGTIHAGNSPATPDGWIPVSERMPDVGDIVLTAIDGCVNVGEMERSGANYRYFTSVISGRELPATHWQALPAAPKEVG